MAITTKQEHNTRTRMVERDNRREACGDKDVFPSSSLLREYVSLEGCELAIKAYSTPQRPHPILR